MAKTRAGGRAPRRRAVTARVAAVRYVESSALLAALLEHDAHALGALRTPGRRVTSALTFAEASRVIVRGRSTGRLTPDHARASLRALDTFERRCTVIAVSDGVLARVRRPFPVEPIRTLDAVHLATAESLGDAPQEITIITRDARIRDNATALGYAVE